MKDKNKCCRCDTDIKGVAYFIGVKDHPLHLLAIHCKKCADEQIEITEKEMKTKFINLNPNI